MVTLSKMTDEDYKNFFDNMTVDYAQANVKTGRWTKESSIEKSKKEINSMLPQGLETKDQYLYSLVEEGNKIGSLWLAIRENDLHEKKAFINDIRISEGFRGKGFGKKSLQAMDDYLKAHDVIEVKLHVFDENKVALDLYDKSGYTFESHYMRKIF